ncbi:MAG: diaminopimelate epimerase, partial [Woeseiaceae bacterium]|nr:diaminopimelate epimerase [Woeseiaceae bacterium]
MIQTPSFGTSPAGRYFIKMHGLRNHFVITDAREDPYRPGDEEIVRICDPQSGVGADQLIILEPPRDAAADVFMRILNVDAREVEACGNATRCVAWLLMEEAKVDAIVVETLAGCIDCQRAGELQVSCAMGKVTMDWREIPLAEQRDTCHLDLEFGSLADGIALNIGNPHLVFFVDDLDAIDLAGVAPQIQSHPLFPQQVNVGVAQMLDEQRLRLAVYERGAGMTMACGSGACVAVYAALARGLTDCRTMTVNMPAGSVQIEISKDG